ncbi:DJ-1/PfpI family protein [Candidatus Micrarchaeota archaeon]|nr:DJ-1/PfpI family protein [Candidatus Micrarchaeota archaeon]
MAKALIILNQRGFHEDEVNVPKKAMERLGHSVKLASITRNSAFSRNGTEFRPDFALYELDAAYFDVVLVVGEGTRELASKKEAILFVRNAALRGKIIGGLTGGPLVLAAAGVLGGKRATVLPDKDCIRELCQCNARYSAEHVVSDGNVVTADDPESSEEFIREIIKILG